MFHIAILRKKYFNLILSGKKTIESRFSYNKIAPYKQVEVGETIYLKESVLFSKNYIIVIFYINVDL